MVGESSIDQKGFYGCEGHIYILYRCRKRNRYNPLPHVIRRSQFDSLYQCLRKKLG